MTDPASILEATRRHVRDHLPGEGSGHDWGHIARVTRMALRLGRTAGADLFVVEMAALLHDIADWKFHGGSDDVGPAAARAWLETQPVEEGVTAHVCAIIRDLWFRGAGTPTPMATLEGEVVQDADRLDALGAIGIARAFAYGGHQDRVMHDPDVPPQPHDTVTAYKNARGTTVNHFHEKLFLLRDRMNTDAARQIAEARHRYMEDFLAQFHREWNGGA